MKKPCASLAALTLLTACTPAPAADTPAALQRRHDARTTVTVDVTATLTPGGTHRQRGHLRLGPAPEADLRTTGPADRHHIVTGGHTYTLTPQGWLATPVQTVPYAGAPVDVLDPRTARALLATAAPHPAGALERHGAITGRALADATGDPLHALPPHIAPAAIPADDTTITWRLRTRPDRLPARLRITAPLGPAAPEGLGGPTTLTLDVRYTGWDGHHTITTPTPATTLTPE